jgi:uridine phosphorylase
MNACAKDMEGNNGHGRFFIIPGSNPRAKAIAEEYFDHLTVKYEHGRGHHLYLGKIKGTDVDVGTIATGMGCPSMDIFCSELILLGCKVLLRLGTAGSMQSHIKVGDLVVATGAVRDEGASGNYAPYEFPSIASRVIVNSCDDAAKILKEKPHFGIYQTKDSLYAREFKKGILADDHAKYMERLAAMGCLVSEMEASHLFILA